MKLENMKRSALLTLFPTFLLFGFTIHDIKPHRTAKEPLKIGSIIPKANVKVQNCGGAVVALKQAGRENGLLVIFSANTCRTVVESHLRIMDVGNYSLDNKVGVIILNSNEANRDGSDSRRVMKTYAETLGYNWLYALDKNSEIADAFGAVRTPECFLFNKTGRLVYRGAIDDSPHDENQVKRDHVKEAIQEMVQNKPVSVKETETTGCPIKRK
jgi:hypothetical protein